MYSERWHLCVTTIEAVYYLVAVLRKFFLLLANLTGFRYLELHWLLCLSIPFEMDSMIDHTMLPYAPRALGCLLGVL